MSVSIFKLVVWGFDLIRDVFVFLFILLKFDEVVYKSFLMYLYRFFNILIGRFLCVWIIFVMNYIIIWVKVGNIIKIIIILMVVMRSCGRVKLN